MFIDIIIIIIIIIIQKVLGRHLHPSLHIWEEPQECSAFPPGASLKSCRGVFKVLASNQ